MSRYPNTISPHEGQAATLSRDARQLLASLEAPLPEPVLHPVLVVVSGLPGTGKSFFSRRLAERVALAVLESDALRRALVPAPLHTAEEGARLFQAIHELIDLLLEHHVPLLLDATNLAEHHREPLQRIAQRHSAKLVTVLLVAPPEVVRQRLAARARDSGRQDHSDADWEVYEKMRPLQEPIRGPHVVVDAFGDIEPFIERVARQVQRWVRLGR